jgi:SAM-dependent methyltransferase
MQVRVHNVDLGDFAALDADRSSFMRAFVDQVLAATPTLGRTLDVGCSGAFPTFLGPLKSRMTEHDGVDPSEQVLRHPDLGRRWHGPFESADVPLAHYDTVLTYNVVEHIEHARPFFTKVRSVLKPGGTFWALTPNGKHPFSTLSNLVRVLNVKGRYKRLVNDDAINDYPAYYRLNSRKQVLGGIDGLGFAAAEFWYAPCVQWDRYFPAPLRVLPHVYDRTIGLRLPDRQAIFFFRLTADAAGPDH